MKRSGGLFMVHRAAATGISGVRECCCEDRRTAGAGRAGDLRQYGWRTRVQLGQSHGFILYTLTVPSRTASPSAKTLRDRVQVSRTSSSGAPRRR